MAHSSHLVWIDLEMTGLNTTTDAILEIAAIITDDQLNIIAHGPTIVIHQSDEVLERMNEWVHTHHQKSGLIDLVRSSTTTLEQAQQQMLNFITHHCTPGTALLAGNSVWQDRNFLHAYMPHITNYLHYRIVDVSTVKELILRWYPHSPHATYTKKKNHRALDDIQESIAELRYYRTHFFIP